ncbi:filamentous hemagglutinin N-terminal domain-containing protein, partial [Methylorubrum sp. Q1]
MNPAMAQSPSPRARALTRALLASTALVGIGLGPEPARAEPLPTGGQVVSGGVTIGTPQNGALAITQSSRNAIVNWQGFSVGQGHRVDIRQPDAGAAILNRVTGATPSTIAGQLNANGQVYLVNPNGVTITRSGQVNAAGFVASSLGITDEDFKAGRRQFRGSGASAPVTNHGAITIGRGGYAALIGGQVTNTGTIRVPMGRVGLGSGERATLDLSGDGFLQVAVPTGAKGRGALVRHSGTISADGGAVTLTAAAARDMARQAVNLSGVIEARSVGGRNGNITLSGAEGAVTVTSAARLDASGQGEADGGQVRITGGRLDVAGRVDVAGAAGGRVRLKAGESLALSGLVAAEGRTGRGGRIVATAPAIATQAALIEASGATGGGVVRVGGGRLGQGPLARAERVSVDAASVIRADATGRGQGGDVVVWSDVATRFAGRIEARGGASGGDGGQAEVSSKGVLSYDGTTILTAARGAFGTLLLDPHDITIANFTDSGVTGFTATGDGSVIDAARLLTALTTANVVVSTGTTGNESGTITVAAPLSWNTGADLTLQAAGEIALNAPITARAGGLVLQAGAGSDVTATADLSVARFTLASGHWTQNAAALPGFATGDFQVASGASFLRATGGDGSAATPYRLTDIYGVQGMGSSASYRAASYRLAADIDAAGTATWWGGQGFVPVGADTVPFTGSLDGAGHTIAGLTIARPDQSSVGLIGVLGRGGRVSGLGLVGGFISGGSNVGGLLGSNSGSVARVYATSNVSGWYSVGGLAGSNSGTVSQAYATGSVSGHDLNGRASDIAGGLIGTNDGSVIQAYATGNVSVSNCCAGGLIGQNVGSVSQAYATGIVSSFFSGGLIGQNAGNVSQAYWDIQTTRQANAIGNGLPAGTDVTGLTSAQARTGSAYAGFNFDTVWYQAGDLRPILRAEAADAVGSVVPVSNLHQLQLMGANLADRYRLTADLDASATNSTAASAGVFGAGGFVPVGRDGARFTGSLDGAGHRITGLAIARPSENDVGLIGALGAGGSVSGLGLVGGSIAGSQNVGGLVGFNNGGTISQAYAAAAVSGTSEVGGLVGSNDGTISQAYATGAAAATVSVGGLVGWNASGRVSQSYASGSVSGSSNVGGVVGSNDGSVTTTYWDTQTTGQVNGVGTGSSTGATGLTTAQARTASSYAGFDFDTVWYQSGDLRPILRSEAAAADANGVTAVSNLHQLQLMGANLAGRYRLTTDLDASATNSTAASAEVFGAGGFVPVGRDGARFTGSLDGAGHTITGLTIARPSEKYVGLIGALGVTGAYGSVSDLGLVGGSIAGSQSVGGLVGDSIGTVSQSYATGSVSGTTFVGGLVGSNFGTVSQSYASASVSGSLGVGGLVGANGGIVSQTYASGSVSGSSRVGGLVGANSGTLTNAYWDTQTTRQVNGVGDGSSTGATGLTTAQMQDLASFRAHYAGFDFDTVWAPPNQVGQGGQSSGHYPELRSLSPVAVVAPASTTRVYGDANPGLLASYGGLRAGDFVTGLGSLSTTATATSDVGSYTIAASGTAVTGKAGTSYRVVYLPGTLTVTQRSLTITANGQSRVYGDANPSLTYTTTSLGAGAALSGTLATAATATSDVGSYAITQGSLTAAANPNYALTFQGANLTVSQRPVTVTATGQNRVYGDANPSLTYTTTSLGAGAALSGTLVTTATTTSGVGSYAITQGSLTAAANSNYAVTYAGADLTVSPRSVTVTATGQNRVYGDANPALTYQVGGRGLVSGDALTGELVTTADARSTIGAYAIGQGTLAATSNYAVSYVGADLTVTARPMTLTAEAQSRVYGDANPSLTYQVGGRGLVNGDSLTGGLTTTADARSAVGTYAIGQGTLAASSNYAVRYVGADLMVTARPMTLTAEAQSRVYGDANPALTYQVGGRGLVNGDVLSGVLATADARSAVGTYAIGQGSLAASGNYAVSYVGADLVVTARPLILTADVQSRLYGEAN